MATHRGHPLSAETRARISRALKGKKHKGHALTPSTRAKISAALKGKKHKGHALSSSTRAKISAALRGKKHPHAGHALTAATRAKISAALRARYAATPRAAGAGGRRTVNPKSLVNLKKPQRTRPAKYALARGSRTHKFHSGPYRLISSTTRHRHAGSIHGIRRRRTRIVIHKKVRRRRVWHRKRR